MTKLLTFILIILHTGANAQVNVDSIVNDLVNSKSFHQTEKIHYLMKEFQRFENLDSSKSFDVYLDSNQLLSEYIGLAMVYKEYEFRGRVKKSIGYNLKGEYFLWDYPPIIHTSYYGDTIVVDNYDNKYKLTGRTESVLDSKGRQIEFSEFDDTLRLISRISNNYNDSLNQVLVKNYFRASNLKPDNFEVSYSIKRFGENDLENYLEEYFYDEKMNLIDADHHGGLNLKYSQIKKKKENGNWVTVYYDIYNQVVCEVTADGFVTMHK